MRSLHSIPLEKTNSFVPDYVKISSVAFKRAFRTYKLAWDGSNLYWRVHTIDTWTRLGTQNPDYPGVAGWMQRLEEDTKARYLEQYGVGTIDYIGPITEFTYA